MYCEFLGSLHIGLVEGVNPEDGARDGCGEFHDEHRSCDVARPLEFDLYGCVSWLVSHSDHEFVAYRWPVGTTIDRNDSLSVLAGGLSDQLLHPHAETFAGTRAYESCLVSPIVRCGSYRRPDNESGVGSNRSFRIAQS
jgi:hypothetical protein